MSVLREEHFYFVKSGRFSCNSIRVESAQKFLPRRRDCGPLSRYPLWWPFREHHFDHVETATLEAVLVSVGNFDKLNIGERFFGPIKQFPKTYFPKGLIIIVLNCSH